VQATRLAGSSGSPAPKLREDIDERVKASRDRPMADEWPLLWLDTTRLTLRQGGQIVETVAMIAVAACIDGRRETIGPKPGPSEAQTPSLARLSRGAGPRCAERREPVSSDAGEGPMQSIDRVLGATRCAVAGLAVIS
jgi:transposase-like protein